MGTCESCTSKDKYSSKRAIEYPRLNTENSEKINTCDVKPLKSMIFEMEKEKHCKKNT